MALLYTISGAQTPSSFTVSARVAAGALVLLQVSPNADMSGASLFGPVTASAGGFAKVTATGLSSRTRYYYRIEEAGVIDTTHTGRCWTLPPVGVEASFEILFGSCIYNGRNPVALVPTRTNYPNALFWVCLGDFHYMNRGQGSTEQIYRNDWDAVFTQPNTKAMLRDHALVFTWSDHDWSLSPSADQEGANGDRNAYNHAIAHSVYREVFPHPTLGAADCIDYSFRVGRTRVIVTDLRSHRDPDALNHDGSATTINGSVYVGTDTGNRKTMMGTAQKSRFKSQLTTAKNEGSRAVVWAQETLLNHNRRPQNSVNTDTWGAFDDERKELLEYMRDNETPPIISIEGDAHFLGGKLNLGFLTNDNDSSNIMICHMGDIDAPTPQGSLGQNWTMQPVTSTRGIGHVAIADPGGDNTVTVTFSALAVDAAGNTSHITGSPMTKLLLGSQPSAGGILYPRLAQRVGVW